MYSQDLRTSCLSAQVMEVVLDFVMAYMEFLTSNLEATAHPILDSIVHKVGLVIACASLTSACSVSLFQLH